MSKYVWLIPPLAGQKVTLNPDLSNYSAHVSHHKATDGVIVNEQVIGQWMRNGSMDNSVRVVFPNGRTYDFTASDIMPISGSFYEFTKYRIGSRVEHGLNANSREEIENRIIYNSGEFRAIDVNKETRIKQLEEAIEAYEKIDKRDYNATQIEKQNQRYATVLEELALTKEREAQTFVEEEQPTPKKKPTSTRRVTRGAELF